MFRKSLQHVSPKFHGLRKGQVFFFFFFYLFLLKLLDQVKYFNLMRFLVEHFHFVFRFSVFFSFHSSIHRITHAHATEGFLDCTTHLNGKSLQLDRVSFPDHFSFKYTVMLIDLINV